MTSIGSINGAFGAAPAGGKTADARDAAAGTIGEIGHRVFAWIGASGGAAASGLTGDFRPDARELARGGDVYGLGDLGRDLSGQFGGTPAEEGALRRSLEGFTREAVIQLAGLSGASPERQMAGIDAATAAAGTGGGQGIGGLIQRLDAAAAVLAHQNGR
jgi:hypothetical protein